MKPMRSISYASWISFSFNHRRPKVIRDHVKFLIFPVRIEFEVRMRVGAEKSCSQHASVRLDWMGERDISVSSIFSSFPPLFQWVAFFGRVSFIPRMYGPLILWSRMSGYASNAQLFSNLSIPIITWMPTFCASPPDKDDYLLISRHPNIFPETFFYKFSLSDDR